VGQNGKDKESPIGAKEQSDSRRQDLGWRGDSSAAIQPNTMTGFSRRGKGQNFETSGAKTPQEKKKCRK